MNNRKMRKYYMMNKNLSMPDNIIVSQSVNRFFFLHLEHANNSHQYIKHAHTPGINTFAAAQSTILYLSSFTSIETHLFISVIIFFLFILLTLTACKYSHNMHGIIELQTEATININ